MDSIVLTRIDSRLIHGQVMTKWVNQVRANTIVVINDELAADEFMRSIYLMSAPADIEVRCLSEAQVVEEYKNGQFNSGRLLLLFADVPSLVRVFEAGVNVKNIQIGGLGGGPSRKVVFQNITLDESDAEALKKLADSGVDIIFQTIPEDAPQSFETVFKKFNQK